LRDLSLFRKEQASVARRLGALHILESELGAVTSGIRVNTKSSIQLDQEGALYPKIS
jgi:hypothetical protein